MICRVSQLMNVLEDDEFARNYQLANKLQKVHLLMRVRVWRHSDMTSHIASSSDLNRSPSGLLKDRTVLRTATYVAACCYIHGSHCCLLWRVITSAWPLANVPTRIMLLPSSYGWCSWADVRTMLSSFLLVLCSLYLFCDDCTAAAIEKLHLRCLVTILAFFFAMNLDSGQILWTPQILHTCNKKPGE